MGIELMTSSLPRMRSTPELHRLLSGAENEVRTRDPQLGRLMLYQLSYFRKNWWAEKDSNLRSDYAADLQSAAIATMRTSQNMLYNMSKPLFEPIEGFEPTTPRLQITCSSQLSYIGDVFHTNFPQKGLQRYAIIFYLQKFLEEFSFF